MLSFHIKLPINTTVSAVWSCEFLQQDQMVLNAKKNKKEIFREIGYENQFFSQDITKGKLRILGCVLIF